MKNNLICLLLAIASVSASAADWVQVSSTDMGKVFLDVSSVINRGKYVQGWSRTDFNSPQSGFSTVPITSMVELDIYDCSLRQRSTLQEIYYAGKSGNGKVIDSRITPFSVAEFSLADVAPDSVGEQLLTGVCSLATRHKSQ